MKRYLYILLVAALAVVACEPVSIVPEPQVEANFGKISIQTTDKSAVVRVHDTYLSVDGVPYDDAKISVEYAQEQQDEVTSVTEYTEEDGCLVFVISDLAPLSSYVAYVVVDGGEYGKHTSDRVSFATSEE